jgi:hypothetical protein
MHAVPPSAQAVPPLGPGGQHVEPHRTGLPPSPQLGAHDPPVHATLPPVGAVHTVQPLPQWALESAKQVLPQRRGAPAGHVWLHALPTHVRAPPPSGTGPGQGAQPVPHCKSPDGHEHAPASQKPPRGHALLHAPQLFGSVFGLSHDVGFALDGQPSEVGAAQVHVPLGQPAPAGQV